MLERCVQSVRAALTYDEDELVVVDSASVDEAAIAAIAARHGARLVRCALPGVDRARNAGWRSTTHDVVLFTDDDVTVDTGWADAFAACFTAHPETAFVTGWIGTREDQRGRLGVAVKDDEEPRVLDASTRGVLGHSASLGVRRAVLEQIGGFDECLGAGSRFRASPEVDLFDRIFAAGHTGRFEPASRAWHDQWRELRDVVKLHYNYGIGVGARLSKLVRSNRPRLRVVVAENLWAWGIASIAGHVRHLDWRWTIIDANRMRGYVVGFVAGLRVKVRDGHFAP
jgi:glycosyltransferase involved in cell wall biosynthesis